MRPSSPGPQAADSDAGGAAPDPRAARRLRLARLAAVAAVLVLLAAAHRLGVLAVFREPAQVKRALVDLGPWGYVAFVAAYTVFQPFGVPGTVFILAAPLIWPWHVAFALSMTGTMAASVVGFSFARFVARDWVARIIPARFRAHDEALAKRGLATVLTLRLIFWMPPLLHAFFGVSRVPFWTHFWGSLLGYLLPLFVVSYFGERAMLALRDAPPAAWAGIAAAMIAVLAAFVWIQRRRARRAAPPA